MRYYPVNLDIKGRKCVVVGGGGVGTRKVKTLLKCGATVTVVAEAASDELKKMAEGAEIELRERAYRAGDLAGAFMVIGATDDESLNARISQDAEASQMLCNIADRPEVCNFILPAIVEKGDLILAVSTCGQSPAFAKKLRKDLEKQFGDEYTVFLTLMGAIRKRLLAEAHAPEEHKPIFEKLIHSRIVDDIRDKNAAGVDSALREILGEGYRFEELISGAD